MTAPINEALALQRQLAEGLLEVVATGKKRDPPDQVDEAIPSLLL